MGGKSSKATQQPALTTLPVHQTYFVTLFGRPDHINATLREIRYEHAKPKRNDCFGSFLLAPMCREVFTKGFKSNQDLIDKMNPPDSPFVHCGFSYRPTRYDLPTEAIPLELLVDDRVVGRRSSNATTPTTVQHHFIPTHLPFMRVGVRASPLANTHVDYHIDYPADGTELLLPRGFYPFSHPPPPKFNKKVPYPYPGGDGVLTEYELYKDIYHPQSSVISVLSLVGYDFSQLVQSNHVSPNPNHHLGSILVLNLNAPSSLKILNHFIRNTHVLLSRGCVFPLLTVKVSVYMLNSHLHDQVYITPQGIEEQLRQAGFHDVVLLSAAANPQYLLYDEYEDDVYGEHPWEKSATTGNYIGYGGFLDPNGYPDRDHPIELSSVTSGFSLYDYAHFKAYDIARGPIEIWKEKSVPIFLPPTYQQLYDTLWCDILTTHLRLSKEGRFNWFRQAQAFFEMAKVTQMKAVMDKWLLFSAVNLPNPHHYSIPSITLDIHSKSPQHSMEPCKLILTNTILLLEEFNRGSEIEPRTHPSKTIGPHLFNPQIAQAIQDIFETVPFVYDRYMDNYTEESYNDEMLERYNNHKFIYFKFLYYFITWINSPNFLTGAQIYPSTRVLYGEDCDSIDWDDLASYLPHSFKHIANPEPLPFDPRSTSMKFKSTGEHYIPPYSGVLVTHNVQPVLRVLTPINCHQPFFAPVQETSSQFSALSTEDCGPTDDLLPTGDPQNDSTTTTTTTTTTQVQSLLPIPAPSEPSAFALPTRFEMDSLLIFDCNIKFSDPTYAATPGWLAPVKPQLRENFNLILKQRLGGGLRRQVCYNVERNKARNAIAGNQLPPTPKLTTQSVAQRLTSAMPHCYYPDHISRPSVPTPSFTSPTPIKTAPVVNFPTIWRQSFNKGHRLYPPLPAPPRQGDSDPTLQDDEAKEVPQFLQRARPTVQQITAPHSRAVFQHDLVGSVFNSPNNSRIKHYPVDNTQSSPTPVEIAMTYSFLESFPNILAAVPPLDRTPLSQDARRAYSHTPSSLQNGAIFSPLEYTYCLVTIPFVYTNPSLDTNNSLNQPISETQPPPIPALFQKPHEISRHLPQPEFQFYPEPPAVLITKLGTTPSLEKEEEEEEVVVELPLPNLSYHFGTPRPPYGTIPFGQFFYGFPSLASLSCPIYFAVVLLNDVIDDEATSPGSKPIPDTNTSDDLIPLTQQQYDYFHQNVPAAYFNQLTTQIYNPLTTGCPVDKIQKLIKVDFIQLDHYEEYFDCIERDSIDIRLEMYQLQAKQQSLQQ